MVGIGPSDKARVESNGPVRYGSSDAMRARLRASDAPPTANASGNRERNDAMEPAAAHSDARRVYPVARWWVQGVLVVLILAFGVAGSMKLWSLKEPPARRGEDASPPRMVDVIDPAPRTVVARIVGHGTVRAKNRLVVVPQVGGRVTWVSPRFRAGRRIAAGERLFEIEREPYQATFDRITAERRQLVDRIALLDETLEADRARLDVARRARELAREEFERIRGLYENDKVGSRPLVEAAERTFLSRENDLLALSSAIDNHPIRVRELNAAVAAADAQLVQARLDLDRTRVVAPFPARVVSASVRPGAVVDPASARSGDTGAFGVLSDLRALEVPVAIDNGELPWLPIERVTEHGEYVFAQDAAGTPADERLVEIRWVQSGIDAVWHGRLARLEAFDAEQRTMRLVVEATDLGAAVPTADRVPLEEGMFCEVSIRGRAIEDVRPVPRVLLTRDERVPVLADGVLAFRRVEIVRMQGDVALVRGGLEPGDRIVRTAIANAMAGMRLTARRVEAPTAPSGATQ